MSPPKSNGPEQQRVARYWRPAAARRACERPRPALDVADIAAGLPTLSQNTSWCCRRSAFDGGRIIGLGEARGDTETSAGHGRKKYAWCRRVCGTDTILLPFSVSSRARHSLSAACPEAHGEGADKRPAAKMTRWLQHEAWVADAAVAIALDLEIEQRSAVIGLLNA